MARPKPVKSTLTVVAVDTYIITQPSFMYTVTVCIYYMYIVWVPRGIQFKLCFLKSEKTNLRKYAKPACTASYLFIE